MLDIISMAILVIVSSSFAVIITIIIIGGNLNKSPKEEADELEEQAEYLRTCNEEYKNKFN